MESLRNHSTILQICFEIYLVHIDNRKSDNNNNGLINLIIEDDL